MKLKKRGADTKYLATLLAIETECHIGMGYSFFFFFFGVVVVDVFELIYCLGLIYPEF